jgi:serine/threonine protein kinase
VSEVVPNVGDSTGLAPSACGSSPTEEFDPSELSLTKLVEGAVLFKKYRLKEKLGSGGMGEVWRVHHIELDCDRALKFIRTGRRLVLPAS